MSRTVLTLVLLVASIQPMTARAQSAPVDPGVLMREADRELDEPLADPDLEIRIPEPSQEVPPGAATTRFVLNDLSLDGAIAIHPEELAPIWSSLLGRQISLADLYGIAASISAHYRSAGYILSLALVPAQEIQDGRVRLEVIEGFVSKVVIEGHQHELRGFIRAQTARIEQSKPLRAAALERSLLLINDLPGVSARAVLKPSAEVMGASDLHLVVTQSYGSLHAQANNYGSKFNGPYRASVGFTLDSILGLHEQTTFRSITTFDDEFHLWQAGQRHFLGSWGTTLDGNLTWVVTEPGSTLDELDVEGDSLAFSVGMEHPFIRSRATTLRAFARFDYLDSDNSILNQPSTDDQLRSLRIGGSVDSVDRFLGINRLDLALSQGLPILDHTEDDDPNASRPDASGEYTKLTGSASRLQGLYRQLNLLVEVSGQYAFADLLVSEQFLYGGQRLGRGYDVGELTGDHGVGILAELQYAIPLGFDFFQSAQVYTAWDFGSVWNRTDPTDGPKRDDAMSYSAGLRANITGWLSADLQFALPLTHSPNIANSEKDPRYFFALTVRWPSG